VINSSHSPSNTVPANSILAKQDVSSKVQLSYSAKYSQKVSSSLSLNSSIHEIGPFCSIPQVLLLVLLKSSSIPSESKTTSQGPSRLIPATLAFTLHLYSPVHSYVSQYSHVSRSAT